jgi:hypothetical protein
MLHPAASCKGALAAHKPLNCSPATSMTFPAGTAQHFATWDCVCLAGSAILQQSYHYNKVH